MFELTGKYNQAKVFATNIENTAISQIIEILNQPFVKDTSIRIMPDVHAGKGCVIGFTMTIKDKIVPNLVGVDLSCGMYTVKLKEKLSDINLQKLDDVIRTYVPSGANVHEKSHKKDTTFRAERLDCFGKPEARINELLAYRSVGTLGGGNHFIEIDKDSQDNLYLVIHTGSRHLGMEVCKYYQNLAYDRMAVPAKNLEYQKQQKALIQSLKDSGREREIEQALKDFKQTYRLENPPIPKDLAFLEGADCDHYLHDVQIVQEQANCNREAIARTICEHMDFHVIDSFHTIHNYIDVPNRILRKGSVSAQRGQQLLIPINMRDGALLCVGKGNPDYNFSAPHGAGRLMSRSKAKETISLDEFKESMKGIFSTSVNTSTIDESPMAYRNMDEIVENIHPTAEIIEHLIPIYNFKASVPDDVENVEND